MAAIAFGTFVLVAVLVFGLYWLLVGRGESEEQRVIRQRLKGAPLTPAAGVASVLKPEERLSSLPWLNSMLSRFGVVTRPMARALSQADMRLTVGALLLLSCVAGLTAFALANALSRLVALAVFVGAVAAFVPYAWVRHKATKRIAVFEEQFPEAIDLISRALRAGHAFTTGLAMVAEEAPQPVAGEFRTLYDQQNFGMPMPDAMRAFAARIPLIDAKFFVTAVLTQRESGGNLAEVLDNLANVIRERFKVKRQVRVHTAHARITGWVLAGLPPALALAIALLSPGHFKPMLLDPLGIRMIMGALVLQVLGVMIIRRLVDIEY
jgi:tight adherence protein B